MAFSQSSYLPLEKAVVLHLNKLESPSPKWFMPSLVEIGYNWCKGSGKEDFEILSVYFCYFAISSPLKKGLSHSSEQIWIIFTQAGFVPIVVKIGSVVLKKWMKMWKVYRQTDERTDDGRQAIRIQCSYLSFQIIWAKILAVALTSSVVTQCNGVHVS